jgi:Histidine kinase
MKSASQNHVPSPGRAYWICQFAGWGFFAAYVLTGYLAGSHLAPKLSLILFILIYIGGFCPLCLHAVRRWILRRNWASLSFARLLPRVTVAVLLLAALFSILVLLIEIPLLHLLTWKDWGVGGAIGMLAGFSMANGSWFTIYFSVHSARRRRELEKQALELQVVARDARLNALREQLNPHFLFNCLNGLRGLIVEDPQRAQTMVTRLAGVLRYSLKSNAAHTVTMEQEMRAVQDFTELEQMRFEERLRVRLAVDPAALAAQVPPMMVQTLVENALKHGISKLTEGGEIAITAGVRDNDLEITVANSGALASAAGETGLGLSNTRERLRLLYGDAASLSLRAEGDHVIARLTLPANGACATNS